MSCLAVEVAGRTADSDRWWPAGRRSPARVAEVCRRARVARSVCANRSPPTWSRTMSTPAPPVASVTASCRLCVVVFTTTSAPAPTNAFLFASEVVVATTRRAPNALASCTAIRPSRSPRRRRDTCGPSMKPGLRHERVVSVAKPDRQGGASLHERISGIAIACRWSSNAYSANAPSPAPQTRSPRRPSDTVADGGNLAGDLEARGVHIAGLVFGLYEPSSMQRSAQFSPAA